jgi:dihydrofolate reductase
MKDIRRELVTKQGFSCDIWHKEKANSSQGEINQKRTCAGIGVKLCHTSQRTSGSVTKDKQKENNMKAIVAVDKNWGIGRDNDLLFKLPGDQKFFRETTKGGIVIIGRRTLESFPGGRPLPNRTNIVITRNEDYQAEDCIICHSPEEAAAVAETLDLGDESDIYVSGGGEIYRMMMPWCDEILVTRIDAELDADTTFPDLDADPDFELAWESEPQEEQGISYRFTSYKRKD